MKGPFVAVVTTSIAAKLWPNQNPIGQRSRSYQDPKHELTVVGVANEAVDWEAPRGPRWRCPASPSGRSQLLAIRGEA